MSTSLALLQFSEDITSQMDKANYTVGFFIDLKKAFDTINHEILIKESLARSSGIPRMNSTEGRTVFKMSV